MPYDYQAEPGAIERQSFRMIRQLIDLDRFDKTEQQVVMRIVHSLAMPELAEKVLFSADACKQGCAALRQNRPILCDVEMVKQGITKRMVRREPMCFVNDSDTIARAKKRAETRSMAALTAWQPFLKNSLVLIGNAPTALFRLLEMLEQGEVNQPSLIIGMPVGFVGAAEAKQALWQAHRELGVECITLAGRQGGSAVTAAACNALLRCNYGEWY
ncbi:MAG: precorrin-8X methylmutase [Gammaproteobacteria bacterium]|nr:MAG: precorrin-8X methylmutase [Gammaproteobacteria bacterium]